MRKYKAIALIGVLVLLVGFSCSCTKANLSENNQQQNKYRIYEVGSDESDDTSEYPFWSLSNLANPSNASAHPEVTITFNGKTYSGKYTRSSITIPNTYVSHHYNADGALFEINDKTGALRSILMLYKYPQEENKGDETPVKDQASCKKIADEIVKNYIPLDEYKVTLLTKLEREGNYPARYMFMYYREVNGYRTADKLGITIDENGIVHAMSMWMLGSFQDIEKVTVDEKVVLKMIEDKANAIYARIEDKRNFKIEIRQQELVKLEDEKIAMLYLVETSFEKDIEDGYYMNPKSLIQLLVTIDNESVIRS